MRKQIVKWTGIVLDQSRHTLNMLGSRIYISRNGCVKDVVYKGRRIKLYLSAYNCGTTYRTRLTERALELALAKEWVSDLKGGYVEIGAVTPYYGTAFPEHPVIDPADVHEKVNIRKSLFECDYSGKNVLSISTLEHVGTGDYQLTKEEDCIDALNKILSECRSCLISFPVGYNKRLDNHVLQGGIGRSANQYQIDICVYGRSRWGNDWSVLANPEKQSTSYGYGPLWANCVCFIEKV